MALTIYATDTEFAASTGGNVFATATTSIFDYPPNGSKDLVITGYDHDLDPRLFEIGDCYDLSWGGSGGGGTMINAAVVRSDMAPNGGGIIVFSGTDENGDPAQIIWTPDFDLEGWYWDNYTPSAEPQFYIVDTDPAYSHTYVCFAAGTGIATPAGPVPVQDLAPGDLVTTLDHGNRPVRWVGQKTLAALAEAAPVHFPAGALGNIRPLRLSQQHRILVRDTRAELLFGAPEVLLPAKAMIGYGGDLRHTGGQITYCHILLDIHAVLSAEGAPCESLFLGAMAEHTLQPDFSVMPDGAVKAIWHTRSARPILSYQEARLLLAELYGPPQISAPAPSLL